MIKTLKKVFARSTNNLNPDNRDDRQAIIKEAVQRTVREYGEALKKLGAE
ncbi:MAG: hypothetical protein V1763_00150 [Parcubacteria group bacterium]